MGLVRAVLLGALVMLSAGFVPVSGCAKGCGKLASHGGDDLARTGARYGDDLARGGGRFGDDVVRGGGRVGGAPVVIPGVALGDDVVQLSTRGLDDALARLPEVEGSISAVARTPTSGDLVLGGLDDTGRTFGKDYARSVDELAVSKSQHGKLMDAFETAQDLAQDALELLADDDSDTPPPQAASVAARQRIQMVGLELEASLATILSEEQRAQLRDRLGSPELIAYRLGKERPIRKASPSRRAGSDASRATPTAGGRRATGSAGSDKVTP